MLYLYTANWQTKPIVYNGIQSKEFSLQGESMPKKKSRRDHETRFKPKPGSLAPKPISVYLPKDIDAIVRQIPKRSEWLRRVIREAVEREAESLVDRELHS